MMTQCWRRSATTVVAASLVAVSSMVTMPAAMAHSGVPAVALTKNDRGNIAQARALMKGRLSTPGVKEALASFDAAQPNDQSRAAEVMLDPVASQRVLEDAMARAATSEPRFRLQKSKAAKLRQWSVTNTVDVGVGPVHWGWFKQSFGWQSNRNTYLCDGNFTGFAGFWSVDTKDSSWSDSMYAHCQTKFDASAVYKGSNLMIHKMFHSWGTGSGWNTFELKNL